ncbi:MAG: hypothetical protein ACXV2C_02750 [Candidatus Bathyarchaeia archaeon]
MRSLRQVRKYLIPTLLILILTVSVGATFFVYSNLNTSKPDPGAYIGVAFCGNTTQEAKLMIDRVQSYTNLFILDSGRNPISANQTAVEEIGDYAVSKSLSIIINLGIKDITDRSGANLTWFWKTQSLDTIKQRWTERWGDKFLGVYYNDEVGGVQLDANWAQVFNIIGQNLTRIDHPAARDQYQIYLRMLDAAQNGTKPQNYDLEAHFFTEDVIRGDPGIQNLTAAGIPIFTSDYCLYWWNYLGGYNVMFAELGWNSSVAEQIALVKGAARLQNKEWGTIITWKYNQDPYLDSGDEIYNQMLTSYEAGAKYIAVFNYPYVQGNNYGVMTDQQFIALQRFWNDINNKKFVDHSLPEAALVLPKNYGWGMRSPNDTIWGFWLTDDRSQQIGLATSTLLARYGVSLDIVYEDPAYPVASGGYQKVYYWNQTVT